MNETLCIRVPAKLGERTRRAMIDLGLLSNEYRIRAEDKSILLPLVRPPTTEELGRIPEAEVTRAEVEPSLRPPNIEELLGFSPTYEIIGDIAVVAAEDPRAEDIAQAIMQVHKHINTVLEATTPISGEYRTREFQVLAGEPKKETIHREYGLRMKIDLEKAYFSPRLSTERMRVTEQIERGQVVVDMFAGVGPFTLMVARRASKVVAIDINPYAIKLLKENLQLNKLENVEVVHADVREVYQNYRGIADHVIMNLPHTAQEFIPEGLSIAKRGGIIHYYDIRPEDDLYSGAIEHIEGVAREMGVGVEVLDMRIVRSYAPYQYNVAIDLKVL